jgi:cell division protein FtsL
MRATKRKLIITRGEKILYLSAVMAFVLTMLLQVFLSSKIEELSMNVEQLKSSVNSQEKKNESLTMKVNELTYFDNIKGIVDEMGLSYNQENIIIIEE